jgi:hypothetical protein
LGAYPDGDPSALLDPPTRIEHTVQARPVHDPQGVDKAACCHCAVHASMLVLAELSLTGAAISIPNPDRYLISLILTTINIKYVTLKTKMKRAFLGAAHRFLIALLLPVISADFVLFCAVMPARCW